MKKILLAFLLLVTLITLTYSTNTISAEKDAATVEEKGIYFNRAGGNETDWMKCIDIPVLGKTCGDFYVDKNNLTIGVRLLVNGHVVLDESIHGNQECLGDKQLVKLIELIPALAPFKKAIDEILKLRHFIPAHIFSVCVKLTNVNITSSKASACAHLDSTLMCFESHCLYSGKDDFGCFTIDL
eukprot:gb/GECH01011518.1/.p1 GENE.gb/GECH01011518.1/~~gb/GECH01011518.1/.p1  ORF type:complete len:184 (+),score=28.05 gb/GECH01011518.1/:1-552(+)